MGTRRARNRWASGIQTDLENPESPNREIPGNQAWRPPLGRVFCVANQKGGVGKTTTSVNLAVALARSGNRTLLVDLDPQCNATTGLGAEPSTRHPLVAGMPLRQSLVPTYCPRLELLPGSRTFRDVEALTRNDPVQADRLGQYLRGGISGYDYVLIDCPPSLGQLTQTALSSSTEVLMPVQCEYFAMEGLAQMIEVIRQVIDHGEHQLEFGGIVLTMYDHSLELTGEVEREVRDFFGEVVFRSVVPRDVAVSESPSHGKSVIDYAPRSRGARAYIELCMEVLEIE
ncbi:MAG: ParA family protein [Pirellulales bacterium]|nr:ParA family protein [Pirellulales bacterium]